MTRIKKATDDFPRAQQSHVPRNVSANALATSKRITRKQRRNLHQSRKLMVEIPRSEPKSEQDRHCAKLKRRGITRLGRDLRSALKRAKNTARILARLDPHSRFYQPMQQEIAAQMYRASWIENEIALRTKPKTVLEVFPDITAEVIEQRLKEVL